MKKVLSVILVVLFAVSMTCPALAADGQQIIPRYSYVRVISAYMSVDTSDNIATCEGEIIAHGNYPVKIKVCLQTFQKGYWETIKSWTSEGSYTTYICEEYAITDSIHQVYVEGYVYSANGAVLETATITHSGEYVE